MLEICCREDRVKPALSTMEHVGRKSHKSNFNSLCLARALPPLLSPPLRLPGCTLFLILYIVDIFIPCSIEAVY